VTPRFTVFTHRFRRALFIFDLFILLTITIIGHYYAAYVLRPVEANFQAQTDFILDASHELKTPIATILSSLEALQLAQPPPKISPSVRQALVTITAETTNLHHLTHRLLHLTQLNDQPPQLVPVNLSALLEHQLSHFQPRLHHRRLQLVTHLTPELFTRGDPSQLAQLWDILLDNAIKYTPSPGQLTLSLEAAGHQLIARLTDTGIGIAPADLDRIFDRFYRVKNKATLQEEGSGLGLSIARQIINSHHLQVTVTSQLQSGTTFELIFPAVSHNLLT
jgi:signal transduction histidine kinase